MPPRPSSIRGRSPGLRRSNPADFRSAPCDRLRPLRPSDGRGQRSWSGRQALRLLHLLDPRPKGTEGCDQDRLPKDELEAAILAQMSEVYADTSLVAAALEEAQAETRARDAERNVEHDRLPAHAAELRRKIDRYVAGFEAGELRASLLQSRVDELQAELAEVEAALAQQPAAVRQGHG